MIQKLKSIVAAFIARPDVQSVARHAAIAAFGVVSAAVAVGGVHSVTTGVAIAAFAAAGRIVSLAVRAKLSGKPVQ